MQHFYLFKILCWFLWPSSRPMYNVCKDIYWCRLQPSHMDRMLSVCVTINLVTFMYLLQDEMEIGNTRSLQITQSTANILAGYNIGPIYIGYIYIYIYWVYILAANILGQDFCVCLNYAWFKTQPDSWICTLLFIVLQVFFVCLLVIIIVVPSNVFAMFAVYISFLFFKQ